MQPLLFIQSLGIPKLHSSVFATVIMNVTANPTKYMQPLAIHLIISILNLNYIFFVPYVEWLLAENCYYTFKIVEKSIYNDEFWHETVKLLVIEYFNVTFYKLYIIR